MRNLITDVDGLYVGNAHDEGVKSGVTVICGDAPFVAGVTALGGAPGTIDTDLLQPDKMVEKIDAIFLSGGSVYGLDSAGSIRNALAAQGRGAMFGAARVPVVCGAILFDLANGGDKAWGEFPPYSGLARQAIDALDGDFAIGTAGAGYGATISNLKGGLGSASARTDSGFVVGALVGVNPIGQVTVGDGPHFWAAPFEVGDEYGGRGWPDPIPPEAVDVRTKVDGFKDRSNTAIAVVATDAVLDKAQCTRLAIMAHDGIAKAIWPTHTPFDGDLVFVISTGVKPLTNPAHDVLALGAAAAATMARSIARGVYAASAMPGDPLPTWRDKFARSI